MASADRYLPETASARARKHNLWIRVHKKTWYTPEEFVKRFGDRPKRLEDSAVELLNPITALSQGRQFIWQMIRDGKGSRELLPAFERLCAFEDKIRLNRYETKLYQQDCVSWPDKVLPPVPKEPDPPPPDYNDLSNELTAQAIETANAKTEDVIRKKDKFTRRY